MSRKDYISIAAAFARQRPYLARRSTREQRACFQVWRSLREELALHLRQNPDFDYARFIDATEK
jgi:hypothetical protein